MTQSLVGDFSISATAAVGEAQGSELNCAQIIGF